MARTGAILLIAVSGCVFDLGESRDSGKIGPEGGVVVNPGGPTLTIPPGALSAPTRIAIVRSGAAAPERAISAVYQFDPAETVFTRPATVSFPVPDGNAQALVYWSSAGNQYDVMPARREADRATVEIMHLGTGYLAAPEAATRAVRGALSTIFWQDDGTKTARSGVSMPAAMRVVAIFVPNGSGYDRLPVTAAADSSFSVGGVPEGRYFLEIDTTWPPNSYRSGYYGEAIFAQLVELTTSTPDLSTVLAARPNVQVPTVAPTLTLTVSNLTPWVTPSGPFAGDGIMIAGSQAHVYLRPGPTNRVAGMTTWSGSFPWDQISTADLLGLPDAAQGDVEYIYQRSTRTVGSGLSQGVVHSASRSQLVRDLTLVDGGQQTLDVTLADMPQTGQLRVDLRNAAYAALSPQVNPAARPTTMGQGVSILAIPHTVDFPDQPGAAASTSLLWVQAPSGVDADYGVVSYGQLPSPLWQEVRYVLQMFDVDLPNPAGATQQWGGTMLDWVRPGTAGAIAPVLGPPAAPLINGRDAFSQQANVGVQPTFSWSPPALGTATSYSVRIDMANGDAPLPPGLQEVTLSVYTGTSVRVPQGFLQVGKPYVATITAFSAPWDQLDRPPLRLGAPLHSSDCVTAIFVP